MRGRQIAQLCVIATVRTLKILRGHPPAARYGGSRAVSADPRTTPQTVDSGATIHLHRAPSTHRGCVPFTSEGFPKGAA